MTALTDGVVTVAFTLIRPLGLTLLFPLLNTRSLGTALIRNSVLLALMVPSCPAVVYEPEAQLRGWGWLQQLPGKLLIGVILGFCTAIPFWAVDMAGFLIDLSIPCAAPRWDPCIIRPWRCRPRCLACYSANFYAHCSSLGAA